VIQIVQSRQRLQQRRQSIVAGRRGSLAGASSSLPTPPAYLHQLAAATNSDARPSSAHRADVHDSQACSLQ